MIRKLSLTHATAFGLLCFSLAACGATNPAQGLVDARTAYHKAETSNAAKLKPAELHVAKESLDGAEQSFAADGNSTKTLNLAYVAMRKAELAESLGNAESSRVAKLALEKEAGVTTNDMLESKENKIKAGEAALVTEKGKVASGKESLANEKEKTAAEKEKRLAAEKAATDAMDALAKSLAVKDEARGKVITLSGGLVFATGQSTVLPGAQTQLDKVADALKTQAEHHFVVEGHTDNQGTDAVNQELSKKRAEAVRQYLIVRGVSPEAISAVGWGPTKPVAENKTIEGRAMNRRVEIIIEK
jgi:outer membrane protein OmpA-like peptidoglycan-associated protein